MAIRKVTAKRRRRNVVVEKIKVARLTDIDTLKKAYDSGHEDGFIEGRSEGYDEGYEEGHYVGYAEGRDEGYEEAQNEKEG